MNSIYLLPQKFKVFGWILLIPSAIVGTLHQYSEFEFEFLDLFERSGSKFFGSDGMVTENVTNEIAGIMALLALVFIGFSKLKDEDEYSIRLRFESLVWAIYLNCAFLIVSFLVFYDFSFYHVMVYNIYTPLIFYIVRFNFILRRR